MNISKHPHRRGAYRFTTEQRLPASRDKVFELFSDAFQLERLTPPWLHFSVLTPGPIAMGEGTRIDYKLRIHGVPLRWRTEITQWDPPYRFVDLQIAGPYRLWRHVHSFEEVDGETVCRDQVDYAVPGGAVVHSLFVKRDIRRIFQHRQKVLAEIFAKQPSSIAGQ